MNLQMPDQTQRDQLTEVAQRAYMRCIDARPIRTPWTPIVDALLKAGMRLPSQCIETVDELDTFPVGVVIGQEEPYVDALAAAGLLPTGVEYGAAIGGADEHPDDPKEWSVAFGGDREVFEGYERPVERLVGRWRAAAE